MNINKLVNQIKFLEIKLIKYQECYITIIKHKEKIKKEELKHKIKKMEYIDKIFSLKKTPQSGGGGGGGGGATFTAIFSNKFRQFSVTSFFSICFIISSKPDLVNFCFLYWV
jgi:hypothetical protein